MPASKPVAEKSPNVASESLNVETVATWCGVESQADAGHARNPPAVTPTDTKETR